MSVQQGGGHDVAREVLTEHSWSYIAGKCTANSEFRTMEGWPFATYSRARRGIMGNAEGPVPVPP